MTAIYMKYDYDKKRAKWERFQIALTKEKLLELRETCKKKFEEYSKTHPDWFVGFVPHTLTNTWIGDDPEMRKIRGLDKVITIYALYQPIKIERAVDGRIDIALDGIFPKIN